MRWSGGCYAGYVIYDASSMDIEDRERNEVLLLEKRLMHPSC